MKKYTMMAVFLLIAVMTFAEINTTELEAVKGSVSEIIENINNGNSELALNEIAKLRNAISKAEAKLRGLDFRGDSELLYGPIEMPAGVYKVSFIGSLADAIFYDIEGNLVDVIMSRSEEKYISTLYKHEGGKIFIEMSAYGTYHLYFEKIN